MLSHSENHMLFQSRKIHTQKAYKGVRIDGGSKSDLSRCKIQSTSIKVLRTFLKLSLFSSQKNANKFFTWETGQTLRNLASFGSSNSTACITGVLRDKALVGNVTQTSTLKTTPMKNEKERIKSIFEPSGPLGRSVSPVPMAWSD